MNSIRSLVRQAAMPIVRQTFAKRSISNTRAALSDSLFIVRI